MDFETSMAVVMLISAALAALHCFGTRPLSETLLLFLPATLFGYCFPFVDVNIFGHYGFDGELTIFTLPFHLGLSWWAFYYLALTLAERWLGRGAEPVALACVTAVLFGALEYQWDLTLLGEGLMELYVPSFASYPYDFHVGVPMFHALLAFNWVFAFHALRGSRSLPLAIVLAWLSIVIFPLGCMACLPAIEPVITGLSPHVSPYWQHSIDVFHFASSFAPVAFFAALWFRFLGRKLGGAGFRDGRVGF